MNKAKITFELLQMNFETNTAISISKKSQKRQSSERVKEKNFDTGEENIIELPASKSLTFQIIAKDKIDEMNVTNVFQFADMVVQPFFTMLSRNKAI